LIARASGEKMYRFGLTETSEKTIEINTLSDLTSLIERISGRRVTVISPTAKDERHLGFDEIIEGLPPGQGMAFQFKRPLAMKRSAYCVRFTVDTAQMQNLLNNFYQHEAYYIFVPYPQNSDIVRNRRNLLQDALAVDVYNIPKARKTRQESRTVRYYKVHTLRGLSKTLKISDPLTYEAIEEVDGLENLTRKLVEREIGFKLPLSEERKEEIKRKKIHLRKLFYLHLSSE
jgi:hypothetical protein